MNLDEIIQRMDFLIMNVFSIKLLVSMKRNDATKFHNI